MNQRKYIISFYIIFACILCIICFNSQVREYLLTKTYEIHDYYLKTTNDEMEKLYEKKKELGEPRHDSGTKLIWRKKYHIKAMDVHDEDIRLLAYEKGGIPIYILEKIKYYEKHNNKLFILSEEGFAIIDKKNLLRIHITVPEEEFKDRYIKKDYIKYLSDFNDFSEKEQKILKSLL